jgi:hypothetical protein
MCCRRDRMQRCAGGADGRTRPVLGTSSLERSIRTNTGSEAALFRTAALCQALPTNSSPRPNPPEAAATLSTRRQLAGTGRAQGAGCRVADDPTACVATGVIVQRIPGGCPVPAASGRDRHSRRDAARGLHGFSSSGSAWLPRQAETQYRESQAARIADLAKAIPVDAVNEGPR